jgi:hypothetical protein
MEKQLIRRALEAYWELNSSHSDNQADYLLSKAIIEKLKQK